MAEEVQKMDELVQRSQKEKSRNSQKEPNKKGDMVAI